MIDKSHGSRNILKKSFQFLKKEKKKKTFCWHRFFLLLLFRLCGTSTTTIIDPVIFLVVKKFHTESIWSIINCLSTVCYSRLLRPYLTPTKSAYEGFIYRHKSLFPVNVRHSIQWNFSIKFEIYLTIYKLFEIDLTLIPIKSEVNNMLFIFVTYCSLTFINELYSLL